MVRFEERPDLLMDALEREERLWDLMVAEDRAKEKADMRLEAVEWAGKKAAA